MESLSENKFSLVNLNESKGEDIRLSRSDNVAYVEHLTNGINQ